MNYCLRKKGSVFVLNATTNNNIEHTLSYLHFLDYCQRVLDDPRTIELRDLSKDILKLTISYGSYHSLDMMIRLSEALNHNVDVKVLKSLGLIKPFWNKYRYDYKATHLGFVFYTHCYSKSLILTCRSIAEWIAFIAVIISAISMIVGCGLMHTLLISVACISILISMASIAAVFGLNAWFNNLHHSTDKKRYIYLILICLHLHKKPFSNIVTNPILVDHLIRMIDDVAFC